MARHSRSPRRSAHRSTSATRESPWQRGSNGNTSGLLRDYFQIGSPGHRHPPPGRASVAGPPPVRPAPQSPVRGTHHSRWHPADASCSLSDSTPQGPGPPPPGDQQLADPSLCDDTPADTASACGPPALPVPVTSALVGCYARCRTANAEVIAAPRSSLGEGTTDVRYLWNRF
jgi:hypothetical protein